MGRRHTSIRRYSPRHTSRQRSPRKVSSSIRSRFHRLWSNGGLYACELPGVTIRVPIESKISPSMLNRGAPATSPRLPAVPRPPPTPKRPVLAVRAVLRRAFRLKSTTLSSSGSQSRPSPRSSSCDHYEATKYNDNDDDRAKDLKSLLPNPFHDVQN